MQAYLFLLPNIYEVLEKIIHSWLRAYLNNYYRLLSDSQDGVRPNHSIKYALLELFDGIITQLVRQKKIHIIHPSMFR